MERSNFRKMILLGFLSVVLMVSMASVSHAATRAENIQKIKMFLSNEAVTSRLTQKGGNPEKMISQLDSLKDSQLEKLAKKANIQVGGAIENSEVDSFWKTWGLIMLIGILAPIILLVALAHS